VQEKLESENLKPTDVVRLDDIGEKCVLVMKKKIKNLIN
jgi:hypothetical protein